VSGYLPPDVKKTCGGQLWAFMFLVARRAFELVVLVFRSGKSKEIELLALRQEVAVLRRQVKRPAYQPADRAMLTLFSRLIPKSLWRQAFSVTPACRCREPIRPAQATIRYSWMRPPR